jgi:hypothetical protein
MSSQLHASAALPQGKEPPVPNGSIGTQTPAPSGVQPVASRYPGCQEEEHKEEKGKQEKVESKVLSSEVHTLYE